jgi:hypothetical protein
MASSELPHASDRSPPWVNSSGTRTPIGVDVGFRTLVAAAPAHGRPVDAFMIDGAHLRESLEHLDAVLTSFDAVDFDTTGAATAAVAAVWTHRLKAQVYDAAYRTVRWAHESFPGAVLVLEDLGLEGTPLRSWWAGSCESHRWAIAALQEALVDVAVEAGVPVAHVNRDGTSVDCHRCGERGERDRDRFWCLNEACEVDVVDADAGAAVSIAKRV